MVEYSEVVAVIEAGWDEETITQPRLANAQVQETKVGGAWIFIDIGEADRVEATTGTAPKDMNDQDWEMTIYSLSAANAKTVKDHLRSLINAATISSGWWHVAKVVPMERSKWGRYLLRCKEQKLDLM